MDDGFNTREAFLAMCDLVRELDTVAGNDRAKAKVLAAGFKALGSIFGVLEETPDVLLKGCVADGDCLSDADIDGFIAEREAE